MKELIFFIKNIFNPFRFEFSLAFANYSYPEFSKKELDFIMYAKIEDSSNIFDKEETQLIDPSDQKTKFGIVDRIKGLFSGRKGLPDPNQEYTMDDWINAQKNPVSRLFNNIVHKTASMVKNALDRRESNQNKNINIPSTPSQNFEMAQNNTQQEARNIIVPVEKTIPNTKKPFVPLQNTELQVESIDLDSKGLEEAKAEIDTKETTTISDKKSGIVVENIDLDSNGLKEAELAVSQENTTDKPVTKKTDIDKEFEIE